MAVMGKLRIVNVKKKERDDNENDDEDRSGRRGDGRFHRPGRIDRSIENGKEYRTVTYDETRPIDDLLPEPAKKQETSVLSKQLDYVLILNFGEPVPKS